MKIALIHDWLRVNAGSEKVIKEILKVFEDDEITLYTLFDKLPVIDHRDIVAKKKVRTSLLQYIPYIEQFYRYLLPVLPAFAATLQPGKADLYISSSHAVAKGFKAPDGILHICYCHTPMRYVWFLHQDYLDHTGFLKKKILQFVVPFLREWDLKTSLRVTHFIANSEHIRAKIKEIYHRDAKVIYPPVQVDKFVLSDNPRKDFYLAGGRFVSYKKIDVVIQAFQRMPDQKLVLIGNGYDLKEIEPLVKDHPNIVWLGYQHDDELILYMQNAKACIFAAKEDFGIMCVEVQATGTPVLALNYGGYRESVIDGVTGYFFEEQTTESITQCVRKFEENPLTSFQRIRENTLRFSTQRFHDELIQFTQEKIEAFKQKV